MKSYLSTLPKELLIEIIEKQSSAEYCDEEENNRRLNIHIERSLALIKKRYEEIVKELEPLIPKTIGQYGYKFALESIGFGLDDNLFLEMQFDYGGNEFAVHYSTKKRKLELSNKDSEFDSLREYISRQEFIDRLIPSFINYELILRFARLRGSDDYDLNLLILNMEKHESETK